MNVDSSLARVFCVVCLALLATSAAACGSRGRRGGPPLPSDGGGADLPSSVDGSTQICRIGETRCRDNFNVEACSPGADLVTLEWVNATTCFGGQMCAAGACVAGVDAGPGSDSGMGCPSLSAVDTCQMALTALCERLVTCCAAGATWCDSFGPAIDSVPACVETLVTDPTSGCARMAADPPVCTSLVTTCNAAYRALTCDAIGTAFTTPGATFDLPPGC